ncbi:MAG: MFS transporter [Dehalococcoidales bacterium]|nr:MFS transporter [Dehalococcoidales bacterium]
MTTQQNASVNKNIILIVATTTAFILPFLVASINVALPVMGRQFNMDAVVMSWVSTSYFLAIAIVQVPLGRLADIFGRRRLFIIGLVIATLASFAGGFANSVPLLIVSRVFQGLGSGMTFNNSVAILTSVFSQQERAKALGISQAGTYLGLSLGPLIGGLLTDHLGWQSIFFLSGGLGVLLVILAFVGIRAEWQEAKGEKIDVIGAVAYVFSIALFMYGFSSLPTTLGFIMFGAGTAGLLFFVWWEARVKSPILDLTLFAKNPIFMFSNVAALVTYISTFAVNFLLSLHLQYINGMDPGQAGVVLIASSVVMTIFTVLAGWISIKFAPRLVATVGMAINCVALIMLIFLGNNTPLWYIIMALAIYGMGIGLFVSPNTNVIMSSVENKVLGVASGTLGTMRTAGMMLSMGVMMILFSVYIGDAEITPVYYPQFLTSVKVGFIIFAALAFVGVIAQMVARRSGKASPGKV